MKKVLSTDYMEGADLPDKSLLKELTRVVESDIKPTMRDWYQSGKKPWEAPELFPILTKLFGGRELELRAEPYLEARDSHCAASFVARMSAPRASLLSS